MWSTGIVMGLIAMLCWGIADFLQAVLIKRLGTVKTILIANLIGLVTTGMMFIVFFVLKLQFILETKDIIIMMIACLLQAIASYYFFKSLEIGEVSIVAPISGTFSLVTVILAVVFLGESLSWLKIASILLIVLGVMAVSTDFSKLKNLHTVLGVKQVLVAVMLWGIFFFVLGLISGKYLVPDSPTELKIQVATAIFLLTNLLSAFFTVMIAIYLKGKVEKSDFSSRSTALLFFANFILYTVAWVAVNIGIVSDLISILTPVSSLYPAVTVLLAVVFFKDKLVFNQKIGIMIILLGIFLISLDENLVYSALANLLPWSTGQ